MKPIRDLTDEFQTVVSAGLFHADGKYYIAWGVGYEAIAEGRAWGAANTNEHGVIEFPDLVTANLHVASVVVSRP